MPGLAGRAFFFFMPSGPAVLLGRQQVRHKYLQPQPDLTGLSVTQCQADTHELHKRLYGVKRGSV